MIRRMFVVTLVIALASCGQSSNTGDAAKASPEAKASAGGDPCTLLADPTAVFGQPVTASVSTMPNMTKACEWRSANGMICGSVTVLGPGWNDVPIDYVPRNYEALVTSLGAFGQVQEVAGLGEEARVVDGGMLGAQLAFRTSKAAVLVGSSCSSASLTKTALAEKVAHAIAERL